MVAELDSHLAADVGSVHIDEEAGGEPGRSCPGRDKRIRDAVTASLFI